MLRTVKKQDIIVTVPKIFQPLFKTPKRKNFIYGGRGSAKSYSVAQYLVFRAFHNKVKILCTRELQKSISDSVHALLSEVIEKMGVSDFFEIQKNAIYGKNGSSFIFAGIRSNSSEIKSLQGVDIAWFEEAQAMSRESYDVLVPTIRNENSILIFTFNPFKDTDPVYIEMKNADENTLVIKANYTDNPYFPEVLRLEMERDKKTDYDRYLWIWEGQCLGLSDAQIFRGKYTVKEFVTPKNAEFHYGCDWGFATDPTVIVRSFIIGNTLYIDQCAGQVHCDLEDTPSLFNQVEGTSIYPIYADNARPETISFMRSKHYNVIAAEKWAGSVEDGITYLRSFSEIIIHPRCKGVIEEFELYQYKVDKQTGEILREPVDKWNHYCVSGDTIVNTTNGRFKIKDLVDKQFNVVSYNIEQGNVEIGKCIDCCKTGVQKSVYELELSDGQKLKLTPNHKVLTDKGYKECKDLTTEDSVITIDGLRYALYTPNNRRLRCITQKVKSILLQMVLGFAEMTRQAITYVRQET